jgi:hypothetical protein
MEKVKNSRFPSLLLLDSHQTLTIFKLVQKQQKCNLCPVIREKGMHFNPQVSEVNLVVQTEKYHLMNAILLYDKCCWVMANDLFGKCWSVRSYMLIND